MTRKNREVADRQQSLQPTPSKGQFTLAGVRIMYKACGGREFSCTLTRYCRTQIFEFPRIDFRPESDVPSQVIYTSRGLNASVTSSLTGHFASGTSSRHYTVSPSLRHNVGETERNIRSQMTGGTPVFVVIEEDRAIAPVDLIKGECSISPEVITRNGEQETILVGGREGKEFLTAWATVDGEWPELPNSQQVVNLILACVRVAQRTPNPIRKHLDKECLVTSEGRFVAMMQPTASARLDTVTPMQSRALISRASEIRQAIASMEQDLARPHIALLINAMYSDEHKDDSYKRLQYLRLWESLAETGTKCLGYPGNVRQDDVAVGGKRTLRELKEYRDDIAHWWTDSIDENLLADLQRALNELLRRKYF